LDVEDTWSARFHGLPSSLSLDANHEYIATASVSIQPPTLHLAMRLNDGRRVIVTPLDNLLPITMNRPVKISLSRSTHLLAKASLQFIVGLWNRGKLISEDPAGFQLKKSIIHSGRGPIYSILWHASIITYGWMMTAFILRYFFFCHLLLCSYTKYHL
jgi:hypothetical protein